jgi:hypothetical protein
MTTQWQLRDYLIAEGHLDEFLDAWTRGVLPLRRSAGFEIRAWTVPGESRFIWLLAYTGPDSFAAADDAYYATLARATLDPDPAQWIVEQHKLMLEPLIATDLDPGQPGRRR